MEPPSPWVPSAFLKKNSEMAGIALPDFRPPAVVIRTAWSQHKNNGEWQRSLATQPDSYIDQRNRIEVPEINPHMYGELRFSKEAKNLW